VVPWRHLQYGEPPAVRQAPAVRQPFGRVEVQRLAVGPEKARVPGAGLRPFLTLADRNGSNNGRGGHEHEKSDGDEQIVHGTDHPIQLGLSVAQSGETTEAEKGIGSNCRNSLWSPILQIPRKERQGFWPDDPVKLSTTKELVSGRIRTALRGRKYIAARVWGADEKQPQILRLRWEQRTLPTSLRMTGTLCIKHLPLA